MRSNPSGTAIFVLYALTFDPLVGSPQGACAPEAVIEKMEELFEEFLNSGQTKEKKDALLNFFRRQDASCEGEVRYVEAKATHLYWLGEDEAADSALETVSDEDLTDPAHLVNRLRRRYGSDPDSAVPLVRKLETAGSPAHLRVLENWIHESLAQRYAPRIQERVKEEAHERFLLAISHPSFPHVVKMSAGLRLWVEAQRARDTARLEDLAEESWKVDPEGSRIDRYRLLLADLMERHPELELGAARLRDRTIENLEKGLERKSGLIERYLVAYAYYAKSRSLGEKDPLAASEALRRSALWSPGPKEAYGRDTFYESVCLGSPKEFKTSYAEHLEEQSDLDAALNVWTEIGLEDHSYLKRARVVYEKRFPGGSFDEFLAKTLERDLPHAPELDLPSLEGNRVTLTSLRGKWVLLDFWGTWCLPCVEEMPKIQGLYDELRGTRPGKAAVLTIACHDEPQAVTAFMNTKGYSFPVLLGDEATIEKWRVPHYPFKLLVTPAGRFLTLPGDPSWEEVARKYLFSESAVGPSGSGPGRRS